MLNKNGTTENMVEYHENGRVSYEFKNLSNGDIQEKTFNENEETLTYKNSNGYSYLYTLDKQDKQLAFKDSNGIYTLKYVEVTKEEYEDFIQSFEKPKQLTPIELPSDEEIKKEIKLIEPYATNDYCDGFSDGINWYKEQILNKNK
jgi:hypothetical protein